MSCWSKGGTRRECKPTTKTTNNNDDDDDDDDHAAAEDDHEDGTLHPKTDRRYTFHTVVGLLTLPLALMMVVTESICGSTPAAMVLEYVHVYQVRPLRLTS